MMVLCRHGGAFKNMKTLLRHKLVHHDSSKCMSILCERQQVGGLVKD